MITNLSFFLEEGQVTGQRGSLVKVLNCNFTGKDKDRPIVGSFAGFNAESCNFSNGNNYGLECVGPGKTVVVDCSFYNNGISGLGVSRGGSLFVKNSRMYNNRVHGCQIGTEASKCVVVNCDIHHNDQEGICVGNSKNVSIIRNNVFANNMCGLFIESAEADIRENNIFDNDLWGIWSLKNSWCNIWMNRIFRNKAGGVRVGYRAAGEEFSPSVVELNKMHDNIGPGFVDSTIATKLELVKGLQDTNDADDYMNSYLKSPNSHQSAKCQDNEVYNNKESENVKRSGYDGMIKRHAEGLEEIGPQFSPPPPRDGRRFVVKVQSLRFGKEPHCLLLYDRSLELYEEIQSKVIAKLVQEF
ncbi:Hypothetical predicted protein, partial [Paramuricea clavata]